MEQKTNNRTKIAIIILAVLLGLSLCALAGVAVYRRLAAPVDASVSIQDNQITPEKAESVPTADAPSPLPPAEGDAGEASAVALRLYTKHPEENAAFSAKNLFPGDRETARYRLQVSYRDEVTVHFRATVRPGYETLAQVLKVQVAVGEETLYDGQMKDMPAGVATSLRAAAPTTEEILYTVTAYLDTSVGNTYQNAALVADFHWWTGDSNHLTQAPQTGDTFDAVPWAVLALASGTLCIVLAVIRKRKKEKKHD